MWFSGLIDHMDPPTPMQYGPLTIKLVLALQPPLPLGVVLLLMLLVFEVLNGYY